MGEFNKEMIPVIAVVGPTASGKTALGVELAKAFQGEVISADSMQIYKGMNIASAKPTTEEIEDIPHWLIDFQNSEDAFSVADYTGLAHECAKKIYENGKTPVVVGGTGLYVDSFLENILFPDIIVDEEYKGQLEERGKAGEGELLLEELHLVDAELADRLNASDLTRIIRGLTVYEATKKPLTLWKEESRQQPTPYQVVWIGLTAKNREVLYNRINRRVDLMMEAGLLQEAEEVWKQGAGETASAAIGHKEFFSYFEGIASLEEAVELLKQNTRKYAKRQLTWFRKNKNIHWFYIDEMLPEEIGQQAKKLIAIEWGE